MRLGADTLGALDPRVARPAYDRSRVGVGIVHFGVGGFHRAHQALYVDRLLAQGQALEWGICGVGVLPGDAAMHDALRSQDHLYTVVTRDRHGRREARVVGSIVDHLHAPRDPGRVLDVLVDPRTRIVSLTVTEGGYNIDAVSGRFDADSPAIRAELASPEPPSTMFGFLVEALARRRSLGIAPFTVMSCDNVEGNGDVARASIVAFAGLRDPALAAWIAEAVAFPNSMVDRITPATTPQDVAELRDDFGVEDAWPVVCEPFTQWVLEDDFPGGRPPWEDAGVQLTGDVEPYELMKLRLLNAGHQALAYAGRLAGWTYAHEAAADPVVAELLRGYWTHEARPTLRPVPGVDLDGYVQTLLERFANPAIRDTLARLCAATSDRIPKFVLPVIRANLAAGGEITRAVAVVATWARYAEGVDDAGRPIEVEDPLRDELTARARRQRDDPLAFVRDERLFGDLADDPRFAAAYERCLRSLHEVGARRTLQKLNAGLSEIVG